MMLSNHWLFWLKNWRSSANRCKEFIVSLKMLSDSKELLNFHNPQLLLFCFSLEKEIKIGEWSLEIACIMSVSNINPWILLEMKKIIYSKINLLNLCQITYIHCCDLDIFHWYASYSQNVNVDSMFTSLFLEHTLLICYFFSFFPSLEALAHLSF